MAGRVHLHPGRERSLARRHPWLYRGALAGPLPADPGPVEVCDSRGVPQGIALVGGSGGSLALRMLTFGDRRWDQDELWARLRNALSLRRRLGIDSDAWRLVHAEGDGLPGLVIDRYGTVAVVEPFEPAWDAYAETIGAFLTAEAGIATVLRRAGRARRSPVEAMVGEVPGVPVVIREGQALFPVDLAGGQKTGFFLDQRDNRRRLGELVRERTVLNLFSYSGAFAVAALVAGARQAVNVDESAGALLLAREAYRLNGLDTPEDGFQAADAFVATRRMIALGKRFDVVVVDPPAFVKRRSELLAGLRGYRDINLQALRLVADDGLLLTCSCSALVDEPTFLETLQGASLDARRRVRILERRGAAPDHPLSIHCLESRHLQAWLCAVE